MPAEVREGQRVKVLEMNDLLWARPGWQCRMAWGWEAVRAEQQWGRAHRAEVENSAREQLKAGAPYPMTLSRGQRREVKGMGKPKLCCRVQPAPCLDSCQFLP